MKNTQKPQTKIAPLSATQKEAWRSRTLPGLEKVGDGVWALPIPIPNNPLVYTYCYVVADASGPVLIDPGWDSDEGWKALESGLHRLGFAPEQVVGIAISHYHRDHLGQVPRLLESAPDAWLAVHGNDIVAVDAHRELFSGAPSDGSEAAARFGVPQERAHELGAMGKNADRPNLPVWPERLITLADMDLLPVSDQKIQAIWTPGHTSGHSAFLLSEQSLFMSGDHILPDITPNVGLDAGSITHGLADYLGSLQRMNELEEDIDVLPAHGYRFRGVRERSREIFDHHEVRLDEIRQRWDVLGDKSVYNVAAGLHWSRGFDSLSHFNLFAALAETAAHMYYLELDVDRA